MKKRPRVIHDKTVSAAARRRGSALQGGGRPAAARNCKRVPVTPRSPGETAGASNDWLNSPGLQSPTAVKEISSGRK